MKRSFALIAPYAAWMILMTVLPTTAWAYAVRGAVTALLLLSTQFRELSRSWSRISHPSISLIVGLVVFMVWVVPEPWIWAKGTTDESVYRPEVCGWGLTIAKLCASAFVISAAEELFFRKWLVEFAGFGWMLVLFGLEHMRFDLGYIRGSVFIAEGVFAGFCYGLLAKKYGILSAIIAHAATNLFLGLYVIMFNKWFYW